MSTKLIMYHIHCACLCLMMTPSAHPVRTTWALPACPQRLPSWLRSPKALFPIKVKSSHFMYNWICTTDLANIFLSKQYKSDVLTSCVTKAWLSFRCLSNLARLDLLYRAVKLCWSPVVASKLYMRAEKSNTSLNSWWLRDAMIDIWKI